MPKDTGSTRLKRYQIERPHIFVPSEWKMISHNGDYNEIISGILSLIDDQGIEYSYPNFTIYTFKEGANESGVMMLAMSKSDLHS